MTELTLKELIHDYYINSNAVQSSDVIANEITNIVKDWLKTHHREEPKYNAIIYQDYFSGWKDCLDVLKKNAR